MNIKLILTTVLALAFVTVNSQDSYKPALSFEVNKVYPAYSITSSDLKEANTIKDLNRYFKASWVSTYKSVSITAKHKGQSKSSVSQSNILTADQKQLLATADIGAPITIDISYIPDNDLPINEVKDINFTVTIEPDVDATYGQGNEAMLEYLKNYIEKIPDGTYEGYALTAVKFTVAENGEVQDAYIFDYPREEAVDQLLLDAVCNMPTWSPAHFSNGDQVKQEFAFTVGNMENCIVNMLNIKKLSVE